MIIIMILKLYIFFYISFRYFTNNEKGKIELIYFKSFLSNNIINFRTKYFFSSIILRNFISNKIYIAKTIYFILFLNNTFIFWIFLRCYKSVEFKIISFNFYHHINLDGNRYIYNASIHYCYL